MIQHLHLKDFIVKPWKNGGGMTTELFCFSKIENNSNSNSNISNGKNNDHSEEFLLRLSTAQVQNDGPFSIFPKIDRTLILLSGKGMILKKSNGGQIELKEIMTPIHFNGEEQIHCSLINGPCLDFNLMRHRDFKDVQLSIVNHHHNQRNFTTNKNQKLIFDPDKMELYIMSVNESLKLTSHNKLIVIDFPKP